MRYSLVALVLILPFFLLDINRLKMLVHFWADLGWNIGVILAVCFIGRQLIHVWKEILSGRDAGKPVQREC